MTSAIGMSRDVARQEQLGVLSSDVCSCRWPSINIVSAASKPAHRSLPENRDDGLKLLALEPMIAAGVAASTVSLLHTT
jgi:hypothetical protein